MFHKKNIYTIYTIPNTLYFKDQVKKNYVTITQLGKVCCPFGLEIKSTEQYILYLNTVRNITSFSHTFIALL